MRNLTKVLALVLSLAFVMTMFAGAINLVPKYSDSADLSAAGDEAVSVLSALDIVDGYLDGSYQGSKAVTRAEYAKLIAIASNGYDATPFYDTTSVNFVDAVDAWALPYVNYCYLTGILAGYTDGTVKAANAVKGVEAIKMTLVALGYNPVIEGLVGANWVENTVTLARRAGLLVNLEAKNLYAEFDREATAILVYNALYADVVEYVGNTATATGVTLGEDAFDLLDVTATIVATDAKALGNVYSDLMVKDDKATAMYLEYDVAKKDTTTVVYRAYVADTKGGYFTPVVLNLAIDTNNDDLGKVYRILTTNTNAAAGRTVYGVLEANPNGLTTKFASSIAAKDFNAMIDKMAAKAAAAGVAAPKNILIDNAFASFADAKAWFELNDATNGIVVTIDNNTDGTVDTLKVYTRYYYEVIDVDDTYYFIKGGAKNAVESKKVADFGLELVEGDWISYDALKGYQKLTTVSGMVTAIGSTITLNGVTVYGGETLTCNAFSAIVAALGGQPGVNATIWYDADGKAYAVDGIVNDAASWANYGIITGWSADVLGMQTVRLFTADNTYKTFVVTSINGNKAYDQYLNSAASFFDVNTMVKYYVDGNTVALYDYDSNLMIGEAGVTRLSYSYKYDLWNDNYTWNDAVIFATVGEMQTATSEPLDFVWRAYKHGEFQPRDGVFAGTAQAVVNNLSDYIKVAAIYAPGYTLPGLVLGNDMWLTLTADPKLVYTNTEEDGIVYTYELTYVVANTKPSTTTTAQIKSNLPLNLNDVKDGDILRATFNEAGEVIYWVDATPNKWAIDSNGLELGQLMLNFARTDAKGVTEVKVNDVIFSGANVSTLQGVTMTLADDCNFYLVKNIGHGKDCTTVSAADDIYGTWTDVLNRAAAKNYTVYADVNTATYEINSIWVDTTVLPTTVTRDAVATLVAYDEINRVAEYSVANEVGAALTVKIACEPEALPCIVGGTTAAKVTYGLNNSAKYVEGSIGTAKAAVMATSYNTQRIVWEKDGSDWTAKIYGDVEANEYVKYTFNASRNIWWERSNYNNRLNPIGGPTDDFYKKAGDVLNADLAGNVLEQNFTTLETNDAFNYEEVILVDCDGDSKIDIMVLVDSSAFNAADDTMANYPYAPVAVIAE